MKHPRWLRFISSGDVHLIYDAAAAVNVRPISIEQLPKEQLPSEELRAEQMPDEQDINPLVSKELVSLMN
jgi:hypothetical protein